MLERLDKWIRRRLRSVLWKQWKRGRTRYRELRRLGLSHDHAATTASGSRYGPWHMSSTPGMNMAVSKTYLDSLGLPRLLITSSS